MTTSNKSTSKPWLSDEEIIVKYEKWCKDNGLIFVQPSLQLDRTEKYAYLSNNNGYIARFNLSNHRFETEFKKPRL